jgi:MFS family permease
LPIDRPSPSSPQPSTTIGNQPSSINHQPSSVSHSLRALPRPVWLLGWVSLATDAASEAIYPILPFFLIQVLGASAVSLGIVEGAAEAANSILKIASGWIADRSRVKRPIVLLGYGLSSAVRPLIALSRTWTQVFAVRSCDRIGKGIRGAPRDAMLAGWATPTTRGRVYGFHRAMDNLGAVIGPTLAWIFLLVHPGEYRTLFALTIVPGAVATVLILFVPEHDEVLVQPEAAIRPHISGAGSPATQNEGVERLPRRLQLYLGVLVVFALGNSSDAFLLLRLTDAAGSARYVPLMWAALHVVKSSVSVAGGSWSDRAGRRKVIALGWLIYAVVYGGFAVSSTLPALLAWFLAYGLYFGFTEGTERALVADLAPPSRRGFAFGLLNAVQGFGALAASVMFGGIWEYFGAPAAFGTGAVLALVATVLLLLGVPAGAPTAGHEARA